MSDKPRKFWQIHLSTAIATMVMTGLCLYFALDLLELVVANPFSKESWSTFRIIIGLIMLSSLAAIVVGTGFLFEWWARQDRRP